MDAQGKEETQKRVHVHVARTVAHAGAAPSGQPDGHGRVVVAVSDTRDGREEGPGGHPGPVAAPTGAHRRTHRLTVSRSPWAPTTTSAPFLEGFCSTTPDEDPCGAPVEPQRHDDVSIPARLPLGPLPHVNSESERR